ncbi:hypothetical protein J6590_054450, partial [Homalodisca vitripennis]
GYVYRKEFRDISIVALIKITNDLVDPTRVGEYCPYYLSRLLLLLCRTLALQFPDSISATEALDGKLLTEESGGRARECGDCSATTTTQRS